jgi:hypothetical protein
MYSIVAGQSEFDSKAVIPGVTLCIFMLKKGSSCYGKCLLYSFFFEAFSKRLNNVTGQFRSVYALQV